MNTKQLLGVFGSIILLIGVFAPLIGVPTIGHENYFQNGRVDGIIVMILAIISLILALAKKYNGLWFTGLGSLGVMLFTFINFQIMMSRIVKIQMESRLAAGNPLHGFSDSVQLQWGWALLFVGAALVITSAAVKEDSK